VKWDPRPVPDINGSVSQVCQASYGYMGDLMRLSESMRWLGPARYNYAGAVVMAKGKSYKAHVSYLPAERFVLPLPILLSRSIMTAKALVERNCRHYTGIVCEVSKIL
jgi:hypothetical protein